MDKHIANSELTLDCLPPKDAKWEILNIFAHTYNGYVETGSFEQCAEIAVERRHDTLSDLRCCLFFEARKWRHCGDDPDDRDMKYIHELVENIRQKVNSGVLI